MAIHELVCPNWRPASLNELLRSVRRRIRRKAWDRDVIAAHALQQRIPRATGPRRVGLRITLTGRQKPYDVDAPFKSLLDALKCAGLIRDDSPDWCRLGEVVYNRGEKEQTVIVLEDLEG